MGLYGDFSGNTNPDFTIGKGVSGNKKLIYGTGANTGELTWNPTGNKSVIIPDKNGTIATLSDIRNYGSFTVGGNTSTFYPVLFNSFNSNGNWNGISRLKLYRPNVHENFYGAGSFIFEFQVTYTNYGNIPPKTRILNYQRGDWAGGLVNDPVGNVVDASFNNANNEVIFFLRGGVTYYWHNPESGTVWSVLNTNTSGVAITDTEGNNYSPTTAQIEYISVTERWKDIPLFNGWSNFGSPYPNLSIYKSGDTVCIRGLISHTNPSNDTVIGYLPISCVPSKRLIFLPDTSNNNKLRIDLTTEGEIRFLYYQSGSGTIPWVPINFTFIP